MCTLSFFPEKDGYVAAMNRDELRTRAAALPPAVHQTGELASLYPRESGGGTWVGANSIGNLFALLNWYSIETANLGQKSRSRGELIPALLRETNLEASKHALLHFDFSGIYPFRLFGFFPCERQIREWQWDGVTLQTKCHEWGRHHWFSSSRSDKLAESERGKACERTWREGLADPTAWLRELHASHIPEPGPFSVCVHREDAATVSYTEVLWENGELQMRYIAGNPCQSSDSPERWTILAPAVSPGLQ